MYQVGSLIEMKKPMPVSLRNRKKGKSMEITRVGADIKLQCTNCNHVIMLSRHDFERKMKKVLQP
ncbi:DUF951 family protein [Streptococcus equi subsp. zooepidemicus]|nr:DUF951 domain-containing protein [Streptococcus equi]MCD3442745.1 DUF951 family protein [Streptococcus equi subsp. zooepidemicus]